MRDRKSDSHRKAAERHLGRPIKPGHDIDHRNEDKTDDSKANLWQYVDALRSYAELHEAVPDKVLGRLEAAAEEITGQMRRGELDLQSLDLAGLGKTFLADFSEEELVGLEGRLPEVCRSLADVVGSMSGNAGPAAALLKQLAGQVGSGGVDLEGLARQLSSSGGGVPTELLALAQQLAPPPPSPAKRRR